MGSFIRDLIQRIDFFSQWTVVTPVVFWLSAFTFPTSFLTAVLQRSARAAKLPIDILVFEYIVSSDSEETFKTAPANGVYVQGLFLESASWNVEKSCLQEPKLLELICPMPVIFFKTSSNPKRKSKKIYECPTYYYPIRAARGPIISFVTAIDLHAGEQNSSFWIKRATALLLSLSN